MANPYHYLFCQAGILRFRSRSLHLEKLKYIKESQLAGKEVNGVIEYYPTGSPFDIEKPVQKMTDEAFRKSYLLQKNIIKAFQAISLIRNAKYFGYLGGFNFKFELVNPSFENFVKQFNYGKAYFERKNGKYILHGVRIKAKNPDGNGEDSEEEIVASCGKFSCTNKGNVCYDEIKFNARRKLKEIIIYLIESHPTGLTGDQIIKKFSKRINLQSLKQDIAEINTLSTKQFGKAFINHERGKDNPYQLNI